MEGKIIIDECEKFMKENIPESRINGTYLKHVSGCRKYALELAKVYDADEFVIEVAALLHDIGANAGKQHSEESARLAEEFLSQFDIPRDVLEKIVGCIKNHSMWGVANNLEEQIIQDADGIIFLEDTYKDYAKKMFDETGSMEEVKKLTLDKIGGMRNKVKTDEGIKIVGKLLPTAIEDVNKMKGFE